jgi:hypothetical protein
MHAPEVFLKHAAACDGMAKFTRDSQSCAAWKGMAERWRQCAERAKREVSSSAQQDSHDDRRPLLPENQ